MQNLSFMNIEKQEMHLVGIYHVISFVWQHLNCKLMCFSYRLNFTMRITIMASQGSLESNLLALRNIVVNLDSNEDMQLGQEPEVDVEDDKVLQGVSLFTDLQNWAVLQQNSNFLEDFWRYLNLRSVVKSTSNNLWKVTHPTAV